MIVVSSLFHLLLVQVKKNVTGAKLIYLSPYSPNFNPIEPAFHSIKSRLCRHESQALTPGTQPWLIYQAADAITKEMARGWILNCGYSFNEE